MVSNGVAWKALLFLFVLKRGGCASGDDFVRNGGGAGRWSRYWLHRWCEEKTGTAPQGQGIGNRLQIQHGLDILEDLVVDSKLYVTIEPGIGQIDETGTTQCDVE